MLPPLNADMKIAEFGAGTGRFTIGMLQRGLRIIATDINQGLLNELQAKLAQDDFADRCELRIDNIFELSFEDATFDFGYSLHVIPRFLKLEDQRAALLEVARTIKPGGKLLFNYRNMKSLIYGPFYKGPGVTPADIDQVLKEAGMKIVAQRGKWIITRGLLNALPLFAGRLVAGIDRLLLKFWTRRSWDVFVLAEKQ
jgi:ubiquinone/menaquinone biosynthesis C-methylase UbiE